jgi:solute:Na+ symporter, SSS family
MIVTFGAIAAFFVVMVAILQFSKIRDKTFADYAVGDRSFDARYQAMSFLNTWYPGAVFIAFGGMAASAGVISFYLLSYSLLTVVLMYLMAKPVWVWGKAFDLKTQPDLLALRYDSRPIRTISAVVGIVSGLPWLILGMVSLGTLFRYMSLGALSYTSAVVVGIVVITIRQIWTVRMGMRGVVISDMAQGLVAYIGGTLILVGLIVSMASAKDIAFATLDARMFAIGSKEGPLYLFSLILTGALGGWCWPVIFVRLFTADGVRSLKKSAALAVPLSLAFAAALLTFGMLASALPSVAARPDDVWFIVSQEAGGHWLLGLAGVVVLAASMGNIDGHIQATGAQLANDLVGNFLQLGQAQLIAVAKWGMVALTPLAAWIACLDLPALFSLAIMAYQGIIQLAVPQVLGIFWKRGNKQGAIAGMVVGFLLAVTLEFYFPLYLPWAFGLTSGVVAMAANLVIYVAAAYLLPQTTGERRRVDALFARLDTPTRRDAEMLDVAPRGLNA